MDSKKFAFRGGMVMLLLGALAFIPALSTPVVASPLVLDMSYGYFLGFVPMNVLNKTLLMVLGTLGVMSRHSAGTRQASSTAYSRFIFGAMAILVVLGLIPATSTLMGYMPLYGMNILVHGLFAAAAAVFGFVRLGRKDRAKDVPMFGTRSATR